MASKEVPTGRRINGAQTFMWRDVQRPNSEGRKKSEFRRPKPASRGEAQQTEWLR
jgi:hypothetical protein